MAKKKIKDIAAEMLTDFLAENGLELFNIEYVKEGKQRFLRVYIDKPPAEDGTDQYIDIEECEKVSRYLSDRLDEADPVEENYTLEVSFTGSGQASHQGVGLCQIRRQARRCEAL